MRLKKFKQQVAAALAVAMSAACVMTPLAGIGTQSSKTKSVKVTFNAGDGGTFDLDNLGSGSDVKSVKASRSNSSTETKLVRTFTKLETDDDGFKYTSLFYGGEEMGEDYENIITPKEGQKFYGWYHEGVKVDEKMNIYSDVALDARWYDTKGNLSDEEKEELAVEADLESGNDLILDQLKEETTIEDIAANEAVQETLKDKGLTINPTKKMFGLDISVQGSAKKAKITMNVPDMFEDADIQNLGVIHFEDDFSAIKELITPSQVKVEDNRMTFTMNGFSPVIVVPMDEDSGDPKVTIKNVKNGYLTAWTETYNEETHKTQRTYFPFDEAVSLKAGTEIHLQPEGYNFYYADGWHGRLESVSAVFADPDKEPDKIEFTENIYDTSCSYQETVYMVKESCTIEADFTRWVPKPEYDADTDDPEREQPKFQVQLKPYSSGTGNYKGRVSVKMWNEDSKEYKAITGYQVRIATEKELKDANISNWYVENIDKFTCKDNVITSKGTLELGNYTLPIVIVYEDQEYLMPRKDSTTPYTVYMNLGENGTLYHAVIMVKGSYNSGSIHLASSRISISGNAVWKDVKNILLEELEDSYIGIPSMYHYSELSWQDSEGKELTDNYQFKGSVSAYTLFKKADGTKYQPKALYDDGPLSDVTCKVTIENVNNGYILAYTGNGEERVYLPIDEAVELPEGTKLHLYAEGYEPDEEDWVGTLTSLKLVTKTGETEIMEEDYTSYDITVDQDFTVKAVFAKVLPSEWTRDRFRLTADVMDNAGIYKGNVSLSAWNEETQKYEKAAPSEYQLRFATDEEIEFAGRSTESFDSSLFTYKDGVLSSVEALEVDSYQVPFVITYHGEQIPFDEDNFYTVSVPVGISTVFYHVCTVMDGRYQLWNGSYYVDTVRFEKKAGNKWIVAKELFDSEKQPKMYNYDFVEWQNYKGQAYKDDSPMINENENSRYYTAFDSFVKKSDNKTPYHVVAKYGKEAPVNPDDPENPNNPNNPNNPSRPGGNTGSRPTGGSGSSGGRRGAGQDTYYMHGKWIADGANWKFKKDSGEFAVNAWGVINGSWYYFNAQGIMVTGWSLINGQWYYFNPAEGSGQGIMVTGWHQDPSYQAWFYFNESGAMVTGWNQINGKWYYLNPISNGTKGAMASGTYIDTYYVGADGAWIASN